MLSFPRSCVGMHTTEQSIVHRSLFTVDCQLSTVNYFQDKPSCRRGGTT
ncbi:MAG: hypothetical protein H8E87_06425 [FCB group bacterium]|nr:hypothetical protein [FCB group bacterium]